MQTKKLSLLETCLNTFTGFVIAFFVQMFFLTPKQSLLVTVILTIVSIARSYIWRRIFNKIHK